MEKVNEKRLSIKDFKERLEIFEGNSQRSASLDFNEKIALFEGKGKGLKKLKEVEEKKVLRKSNIENKKFNFLDNINKNIKKDNAIKNQNYAKNNVDINKNIDNKNKIEIKNDICIKNNVNIKNNFDVKKNTDVKNINNVEKIIDIKNKNDIKNNIDTKNKVNKRHIDQMILERLKIFYNPNQKNEQQNTVKINNNPIKIEENSKNKLKEDNNANNSQEKQKKYINKYVKVIKNKEDINELKEKNNPKKLNLKEIFKNMNIDQKVSNVKQEERKELINLPLTKKEVESEVKEEEEVEEEEEKSDEIEINSKKIEEKNIIIEKESKDEINNEKSIDKIEDKNIEEINKEETIIQEEKYNRKKYMSSLIDLYNKKNISINNNIQEPSKPEKDKNQISIKDHPPNSLNEIQKPPVIYINNDENIFLKEKSISSQEDSLYEYVHNKFCECFFLASFPTDNGKIAPNSENLPADCGHDICSKLPAMEPDIIYKYPEDVKNFEINNLAASICFPNGIKLCYEDNEELIVPKNYRSTITNQNGNMFFVYTYHFYLKMSNIEFANNYIIHPIRYQLSTYQDELCSYFNEEFEATIVQKLDIYSQCNYKDYIYIPFCLGLISKYPYYPQLEQSLISIFETLKNSENEPSKIYNLINYILNSIPAPHKNSKVSFALPYINRICEINYPYFQDVLLFGNNPMVILEHISITNIICIFKLLILEQKILVIGKDMDKISEIILNFISLLYPFEWIHTYIPVMSMKMLKFLQSFLPFFNGMNISLFESAKSILSKSEDVFIINIDEDTIDISSNLKDNDKYFKAINYINKNFSLPRNIENLFWKELKSINIELEKYKNYNIFDKKLINSSIKNLFLQVFVEILVDYDKYTYMVDDYPVFNAFSMINDKQKSDKKFYEDLSSTQIFQMFIQKSLFNEESNLYFDNKIKEYIELQKQGLNLGDIVSNQSKSFYSEFSEWKKIDENYIIKPFLIHDYNKFEKKMMDKKNYIIFKDVNEFIYSQNFKSDNQKNIENENKSGKNNLIIDKLIKFDSKEMPTSYNIFLIPNNLNKKQEKDLSINNVRRSSSIKRRSTKIRIIQGEQEDNKGIRFSYMINEKNDELNEEQKEEITDNIKDIMKRVYKSKLQNIKEDQEILMDSVKTKFGRDYFINIVTSGNKRNLPKKIVENDSFDFLNYIIFSVLLNILKLEENTHNLISAIKLTKACLYIKTLKNKKEVSLSDEIFPQLENYSIYDKKIFWLNWIEDEMTKEEIEIYKTKKMKGYDYVKEMKNYQIYSKNAFEIIDKMLEIMINLNLSSFSIYSIYSDLIQEYIFETEQVDKLMKQQIDRLKDYKMLLKK